MILQAMSYCSCMYGPKTLSYIILEPCSKMQEMLLETTFLLDIHETTRTRSKNYSGGF